MFGILGPLKLTDMTFSHDVAPEYVYSAENKAASIETACMSCPRNRGGIAFAGADDGTLYLDLFPLPCHVLTPRVQIY